MANLFKLSDVIKDFLFLLGIAFGAALSLDSVLAAVVFSMMHDIFELPQIPTWQICVRH